MIFDYIAVAIRTLLEKTNDHFFEQYHTMTLSRKQIIRTKLKKLIPAMYEHGNLREMMASDLSLDSDASKQIQSVVIKLAGNEEYMELLVLVILICETLSGYKSGLSKFTDSYYRKIDPLNSNQEQTDIILLPRLECGWQHERMRDCFGYSINNLLNNIYYIDNEKIKGKYKIQNYILREDSFYRAKHNGKIRVGISPLTCSPAITEKTIDKYCRDDMNYFSVTGVENAQEIDQNLIEILKKARSEEVDILVFPEMLGTDNTVEKYDNFCWDQLTDTSLSNPGIVILPSIWKDRENTAKIYIGEYGHPIDQKKIHGFIYKKGDNSYLEDLEVFELPIINILHCEGLGRIVVAVCKDLLMKEYFDILVNDLQVTMILSPSFSTGYYPFKMISFGGFPYDCHIAWINSCAAEHLKADDGREFDIVGLLYYPGKEGVKGVPIEFNKNKDCSKKCNECLKIYDATIKGDKP